jgi:UrcA family protein
MIIKSTYKSVAAAVMFSVLSGISSLGNANLQEIDIQSIRVSYADLNLANTADQQSLYQRLRVAAKEVCGNLVSKAVSEAIQQRGCVKGALDRAVDDIGNEDLAALHQD